MIKSLRLLLGLALVLGVVSTAGCAGGTKSPARIAHTIASTTIKTGDQAIEAWGDWVLFEQIRIDGLRQAAEKLPPGTGKDEALGKVLAAKAQLLVKEGRVAAAYEKYQDASIAAVKAGAATADLTENVGSQVAAAAGPLIALVTELMGSH
jgi:hypothetical protein